MKIKARFDVATNKINGRFPNEIDYSKSSEYQEMIMNKNYIETDSDKLDAIILQSETSEAIVENGVLKAFVESDDVLLDIAKRGKTNEIKTQFNNYLNAKIININSEINIKIDEFTRSQMLQLKNAFHDNLITETGFTDAISGEEIIINSDTISQYQVAVLPLVQDAYSKKRAYIIGVNNCKNITEINAIEILF